MYRDVPTRHIIYNNSELKGQVCVVTGGAKGLGLNITQRLLSSGAKVVIISRSKDRLETVKKKLNQTIYRFINGIFQSYLRFMKM